MKTLKFILLTIAVLTFSSCGTKGNKQNDSGNSLSREISIMDSPQQTVEVSNVSATEQLTLNNTVPILNDRIIIRKGIISLETDKYSECERFIIEETGKLNGYITNSRTSINTSGKKQGTVEVRVPSQKLDALISSVSEMGKVMSLKVSGNDVTEEFIDLEARHKTQIALEERLIRLLDEKTAKLTDVVEVEQKLADVRAQIESMEGRLRFLKNQADFSTLTVSIFEPSLLQTSSGGGFFYEIGEAFKEGLNGLTGVLTGLITFLIAFSPVLIFGLIIYLIIRKYWRKRKIKSSNIPVQA